MSGQQVRVLMCTQCGAPVEASSAGGMLTCDYCGATLHVGAAHTGPIDFGHADLGLSPEQAEAARLQSLRKQAEHYDENGPYTYMYAPDDLEYLAASDETADDFIPMALQAFNAAVQRCEASGNQLEAQRRVY